MKSIDVEMKLNLSPEAKKLIPADKQEAWCNSILNL